MFYRVVMRWDNLRWDRPQLFGDGPDGSPGDSFGSGARDGDPTRSQAGAETGTLPLLERAVTRTFDTPSFRGMTFHEIQARSIINRVPEASHMPFRWTINPYRGCSHACFYCFARNTHTYLDLDAGEDFNSQVVVKVNAGDRARRELAAPKWGGEHIAMGANVDPYQRAEGRYALMPEIIRALRDFANPFSILTKGSLILRDLDLLAEAAQVTQVGANVSVGFLDRDMWRTVEPGTPGPRKRLEVCARLNQSGVECGVLMAPIIPYLTDSPAQLEETVRAIAETGATHVTPVVLHLRPGAREWFLAWLQDNHPGLMPRYLELYRRRAYAPKDFQRQITDRVRDLARRYGIGGRAASARRIPDESRPRRPAAEQLTLM